MVDSGPSLRTASAIRSALPNGRLRALQFLPIPEQQPLSRNMANWFLTPFILRLTWQMPLV
jgi:hypothetical protein